MFMMCWKQRHGVSSRSVLSFEFGDILIGVERVSSADRLIQLATEQRRL